MEEVQNPEIPELDNTNQIESIETQKLGRIIVRNLPFDLKEIHLQKALKKFGEIINVNLPIKNENNLNRGFGFVEFSTKDEAQKAIDEMNGQKYKGRTIAVEFSVPKIKYEKRITNILNNTKQTRQDVVQPKAIKEEKEEKLKLKEELQKKREQEKLLREKQAKKNKKEQKKINETKEKAQTLFIRNIGWDTSEEEFKEFLKKFGELQYAVLCKSKELATNENEIEAKGVHKGSGFVQFKDPEVAKQVLGISKDIEQKLDAESQNMKKPLNGSANMASVIGAQLELNGRRLVILEALSKDQAVTKQEEKEHENNEDKDTRNLNNKEIGLTDYEQWVHRIPILTQQQIDQRQHLLKEKETALNKSSNLFVSKTRITIRHLPKRGFFEKELKELMLLVVEEWKKTLNQEEKNKANKIKLIKQVKVLRDKEKIDQTSQESLSNGMGFAELGSDKLALFAVRYLNNMELVNKKSLVVDFSLEDQRALLKRKQKLEKQHKIAQDKKKLEKQQNKGKAKEQNYENVTVDLGQKKVVKENEQKQSIDKISNVEVLNKMLRETISRGKKQRIKKRIQKLEGKEDQQKPDEQKPSAHVTVVEILKKREEKAKRKVEKKKQVINEEERTIMKKIKNKKKDNKRKKTKETDEFDDMLDQYKNKFLKRFQKSLANEKKSGSGAYSSVYKVKRLEDGKEYAMKKVDINDLTQKEKQNALNEVRILASIQHENIIGYKDTFFDEPSAMLCIVMEYADGGDIFQLVKNHQKESKFIDEDEIWKIFIQSTRGISVLHDLQIMHRDLKCANIFLTKEKIVKLGDLNVSKIMNPEVWKDEPYDWRSDIWSLGCVLYEMLMLKPPFRAQNMEGLYKKVLKGVYPKINLQKYSEDIAAVVNSMLQVNPDLRPSCSQILAMQEVKQYAQELCPESKIKFSKSVELLKTIRMPKKLHFLADRLPKPQYQNQFIQEEEESIAESSYLGDFQKNRQNTNLSANVSPQNSLINIEKDIQQVLSTVERQNNSGQDSLNIKKKKKKRYVNKIYGGNISIEKIIPSRDQTSYQQLSTKITSQETPDQSELQSIAKQAIKISKQDQLQVAQQQREKVLKLSNNIQNEIFLRKYDDLSPNIYIHQRNRSRKDYNTIEAQSLVDNQQEIHQLQKFANIYERHNYIKKKIEQTKQELDQSSINTLPKNQRQYQSVPKQRQELIAQEQFLPQIDVNRLQQADVRNIIRPVHHLTNQYIQIEDIQGYYNNSANRNIGIAYHERQGNNLNMHLSPNVLPNNPRNMQGKYTIDISPRINNEYIPSYNKYLLNNPRIDSQLMPQYLSKKVPAQNANRSVIEQYSDRREPLLGYHQMPPPLIQYRVPANNSVSSYAYQKNGVYSQQEQKNMKVSLKKKIQQNKFMVLSDQENIIKQISIINNYQVIEILNQLLRNGRKERSVYSVLGFCQFQIGDFQNSAMTYSELTKICPEIVEYGYYQAQSLLKSNQFDEALEVCDLLEKTHLQQKAKQLKAAIFYEKNEFQQAKKYLRSLNTSDFSTLVNEGCIYFKQEMYDRALCKFNDAIKICGFNSELLYNVALAHFEMREYSESMQYIDHIIEKAYERYPQLRQINDQAQVFENNKQKATQILRETAIVEALNLKAAILYLSENQEEAKQIISQVPIIQEGGTDPVTFHNQAVFQANQNSAESIKKLNYLLNNSLFPPETFQNLLFLYCKFFFFDLAAELIVENNKYCETLLEKDDLEFIQTLILQQTDAKDALNSYQNMLNNYRIEISECKKQLQKIENMSIENKDETTKIYDFQIRQIESRIRILKEKYAAVLTNIAKIYWDLKDYQAVEQIFQESNDICENIQAFNINLAHSIYMQEGRQADAIEYYESIVDLFSDNFLKCETIVLANLCVCYIISKQNAKAEALIQKIEQHEQKSLMNNPQTQVFHLCIVNLVIGTLYCSKGFFEFGISLIIKSLDPVKDKLGTDTWYYTKRCFLALIEKIIKKQFELKESFFEQIIAFLNEAYLVGKNITTLIFVEKTDKQKSTVSYEAKFFKKIFAKLKIMKSDKTD